MSVLTHPWGQKRAKFEKKSGKTAPLLHTGRDHDYHHWLQELNHQNRMMFNWHGRISSAEDLLSQNHFETNKMCFERKKNWGLFDMCFCAHRTTLGLAWTLAWRFALGCLGRANFGSRSAICWGYNLKSLLTTKTDYCNQDNKGWLTII